MFKIAAIFGPDTPKILAGSQDFDPDDIYFGPLLRGVDAEVAGRAAVDLATVAPSDYLKFSHDGGYDALLILSTEYAELPALSGLVDAGVTFVAVGASAGGGYSDLPTVDCANREGGESAARYLINIGHTELGCINLATGHMNHGDRLHGFLQTASTAGHPVDADRCLLNGGYRYDLFPDLIDEWIGRLRLRNKLPTAIFACDFNMAEVAMNVLYARGIDVPLKISVMGFDDPPGATRLIPPLTVVRQPVYEMGVTAARRLMTALLDPAGRRQVLGPEILPTEIVVRGSTLV